jgi:hydrogenase-4 component E
MNSVLVWGLLALGLAVVVVRRRSAGIALVAAQSLLLGGAAVADAAGSDSRLAIAATGVVARGAVLPALLVAVVRGTREARRIASEGAALPRLVLAVAATVAAAALTPRFGLERAGVEHACGALVVLGVVVAAVRRPVVFQALGFLVAENGIFLAALGVAGGMPGAIELALLFDLLLVLTVAAAFGAKIHAHFGTSDTSVLRGLRD